MSSTVLALSGTAVAAIIFFVWLLKRERKAGRVSVHAKNIEESLKVQRKKEQELQKLDKAHDEQVLKYLSDRKLGDKPWWRLRD